MHAEAASLHFAVLAPGTQQGVLCGFLDVVCSCGFGGLGGRLEVKVPLLGEVVEGAVDSTGDVVGVGTVVLPVLGAEAGDGVAVEVESRETPHVGTVETEEAAAVGGEGIEPAAVDVGG